LKKQTISIKQNEGEREITKQKNFRNKMMQIERILQ